MCGKPLIITIGNIKYTIETQVCRLPKSFCNNIVKNNMDYLTTLKLKQNNNFDMSILNKLNLNEHDMYIINKLEQQICENYIKNLKQHDIHTVMIISLTNIETGEITKYKHTLTQQNKNFNIEPTLTESLLGKTTETAKVIKITDNLYISGHSWISEIDLYREETREFKFYELNYDTTLGYYVGVDPNTGLEFHMKNITLEDKANNVIIDNLQNNRIQQVDITSMYYPSDDLVAYKLLKLGVYSDLFNIINNKDMVNNLESTLSDNYNYNYDLQEIKNNISHNIESHENENKPKDEL